MATSDFYQSADCPNPGPTYQSSKNGPQLPSTCLMPPCRVLTDAAILTAEPLDILQLYYSLLSNRKKEEYTFKKCTSYMPHPVFCQYNRVLFDYPDWMPGGYYPDNTPVVPSVPAYTWSAGGAAVLGRYWQNRIYMLRDDLREIKQADGKVVPGLVIQTANPLLDSCSPTIAGTVLMAAGAAVSALVPFSWPILIAELTMAAVEISRMIQTIERQKTLMKTILGGAYAIAAEQNLQLLVKSGQLTNRLLYDEAVKIPVTRRAWELALILGMPHPAMICKRDAPCTTQVIETGLIQAIRAIHRYYRLDLQKRMEDEVQSNATWFYSKGGPVPDMPSTFGDPVGKYQGIYPVLEEHDGKTFLTPLTIKMNLAGGPKPAVTAGLGWLVADFRPAIAVDQIAGLNAVREWLAWKRNPELLSQDFIPIVKAHEAAIASGVSPEPAQVMVEAPAGLFAGKFDPPPASASQWLINSGEASGAANLPAKTMPAVPVGPWASAPGSSTIPTMPAGGIQQASTIGNTGGLLLAVGAVALFLFNK